MSSESQPRPKLLSEQLEELRRTFADQPAKLRDVILYLDGRAYTLLMIVFALPFAPPVSIPGSSTPLGAIIAIIAAQMALHRLPWLPAWLLNWRLPPRFFTKLVPLTARIVRRLEGVLHPRWPGWTNAAGIRSLHFLAIVVVALLLALPLVIPFTNFIPAWAILLLACGLLERDGCFIALGYVMFVVSIVYFALVGTAATEATIKAWHWMGW